MQVHQPSTVNTRLSYLSVSTSPERFKGFT
jgi:hypothetical protein